jgi:hypothetical protein
MMRNLVLAMMVAGCGADMTAEEPDVIDDATKADSVLPVGNFTGRVHVGQITDLTLNSDKTYDYFVQMVDCIPGPCRAEKGTFKYTHSSTNKYLRFYDADGNFTVRYAYKLSGTKLQLRADHDTAWFSLTKSDLATVGESCGGFVRDPKQCAQGLDCVFPRVPDVPGTCQDPDRNPCVAAGGSCVALTPSACNGVVADAREFSCGGGLGIECCFPH